MLTEQIFHRVPAQIVVCQGANGLLPKESFPVGAAGFFSFFFFFCVVHCKTMWEQKQAWLNKSRLQSISYFALLVGKRLSGAPTQSTHHLNKGRESFEQSEPTVFKSVCFFIFPFHFMQIKDTVKRLPFIIHPMSYVWHESPHSEAPYPLTWYNQWLKDCVSFCKSCCGCAGRQRKKSKPNKENLIWVFKNKLVLWCYYVKSCWYEYISFFLKTASCNGNR